MLACTGNHEIEAQSDGNNTVFKSVQTRWKVSLPALALPCPASPCLALPYPALPCLTLP